MTVKDVISRFAFQFGYGLDCRFAWDCHGLPIEHEFERKSTHSTWSYSDIEKFGIDKYNEGCERMTTEYKEEWKRVLMRMGRWVDFSKACSTNQTNYMENVWYIFKKLWNDNLIYRDVRMLPYSVGCASPLSEMEANQLIEEKTCVSVSLSVQITSNNEKFADLYLMTWCVEPWKLIAEVALCVNPETEFVKIHIDSLQKYLLLSKSYYEKNFKEFNILETFKGHELVGLTYESPFEYYPKNSKTFHRVIPTFDTITNQGTGIIHLSPGVSEQDYNICKQNLLVNDCTECPCPINELGRFVLNNSDLDGKELEEISLQILDELRTRKMLVKKEAIVSYQKSCWRSRKPLIYKPSEGWFLDTRSLKDLYLDNCSKVQWLPETTSKRALKYQYDSWLISRPRYYGTPLPIWMSEDGKEIIVVESVEELEKLTGKSGIENLHRESLDNLEIPSPTRENIVLRRIPDVFDYWFESGCFPFAYHNYANNQSNNLVSGNFVSEGLNQINGWIHSLLVIGTCVNQQSPLEKVLTTGLVLDRESKFRNDFFSRPENVMNKWGADALRICLLSSDAIEGNTFQFLDRKVGNIVDEIVRPILKMGQFLNNCLEEYSKEFGEFSINSSCKRIFDRWITSRGNSTLKFVQNNFASFKISEVVKIIIEYQQDFLIYVKRKKKEVRSKNPEERSWALSITLENFNILIQLLAPLAPFISEYIFQLLGKYFHHDASGVSVHLQNNLSYDESVIDLQLEEMISLFYDISKNCLVVRERFHISKDNTIEKCIVFVLNENLEEKLWTISTMLKDEIHCSEIEVTKDIENVSLVALPNMAILGMRLKQKMKVILPELKMLKERDLLLFLEKGSLNVCDEIINQGEMKVVPKLDNSIVGGEFGHYVIIFK